MHTVLQTLTTTKYSNSFYPILPRFWNAIHRSLPPPLKAPSAPDSPEQGRKRKHRSEASISALAAIHEAVKKHLVAASKNRSILGKGVEINHAELGYDKASLGRRGAIKRGKTSRSSQEADELGRTQGRTLMAISQDGHKDPLGPSTPPGPSAHTTLPLPLASSPQDWFPPPPLPSRSHSPPTSQPHRTKPFVFISTFKWELRKGWDRLVEAYLAEFSSQDNVELYILTKKFMADR